MVFLAGLVTFLLIVLMAGGGWVAWRHAGAPSCTRLPLPPAAAGCRPGRSRLRLPSLGHPLTAGRREESVTTTTVSVMRVRMTGAAQQQQQQQPGDGTAPSPYAAAVEQCRDLACLTAAGALPMHEGQFRFPHFFIVGWQARSAAAGGRWGTPAPGLRGHGRSLAKSLSIHFKTNCRRSARRRRCLATC